MTKPMGVFAEAKSYWCPNCGTNLEVRHQEDDWTLYHSAMPGQEFCPNWGKTFRLPMVTLDQVSLPSTTEVGSA
jgi:hypothetical protein